MTISTPDPNNPQPTPGNPNPEPARPPTPPETPSPGEPPGIPPPSPDPVPSPEQEPIQIPPETPPEVPSQPGFPAPMASRTSLFALALLCCIGASEPAAAQTSGDGQTVPAPADPCQAQPDDPADGNGSRGESNESAPELEDCNGVLSPPPTGDREILEKPPDTGTTPVIPPGTLPEQPPASD